LGKLLTLPISAIRLFISVVAFANKSSQGIAQIDLEHILE